MRFYRLVALLGLAAAFALPTNVRAQDEGGEQTQQQRRQLDVIIVQTQKRAETQQTVPVAVTAFTGASLERQFATTLEDLNHSIPNAQLEHVGLFQSASAFFIRGVGEAGIESFLDPKIAVFVDGVYYSRNASALIDIFDLEAVEVLRGPQGTLYGRNAFGGAIVVRTKRADMDDYGGAFQLDVGNHGRLDVHASANLPVVPGKVAVRLSGAFQKLSGYFENSATGESENGERSTVFRPSVRFTPNDRLEINISGEYRRERGDGTAALNGFHQPGLVPPTSDPADSPSIFTAFFGFPGVDPFGDARFDLPGDGSDPFVVGRNLMPNDQDFDIWGITGNADYVTDSGTISFMVNYREVEEEIWTDTDGENVDLFSSIRFQEFDSFQTELRFASDFSDFVDLLVGVYYLQDQYTVEQVLFTPGIGDFSLNNPALSFGTNGQERWSFATYFQTDWHLTDRLTLVVGARYSVEKKHDVFGMPINSSVCPPGQTIETANCNGVPFAGNDPTDFRDFNPGALFDPVEEKWDNLSPRVGLDFQLNDDVFLFAFWQRAFKSGGFVNNASTESIFSTPIAAEQVDNFEIGMKSDWLDNRLRVNINGFWAKYKDLQRTVIRAADTSTGQETFTDNAAGADIYGIELELSAIVTEQLTMFAAIGWLEAEYSNFCADLDGPEPSMTPSNGRPVCGDITQIGEGADATFLVPTNNDDLQIVRTPTWDLKAGFLYDVPLGNDGIVTFGADVTYTSKMITQTQNDPRTDRRPLTTINAQITWESVDGMYRVSVWGKNLNNDVERLSRTTVANVFAFEFPTAPRRYGVTFGANF